MKRAIAFVTALVITAGAVAPAVSVFGADLPAIPSNTDDLSIWDTSTSTPENPYNTTDVFNSVNDMWGDLFDDGRFNNTTVSDFQRSTVEFAVSKYVATHEDEEVDGVIVSYFDDIVDYVCAHPADFDIYWQPDVLDTIFLGNPYSLLQLGSDFYNNLYDYVIANFYTTPPAGVTINGHLWYKVPATVVAKSTYSNFPYGLVQGSHDDVYVTLYGPPQGGDTIARGAIVCAFNYYTSAQVGLDLTTHYSGSIASGYYGTIYRSYSGIISCTGLSTYSYLNQTDALSDFFGYPIVESSGDPVSNGKVFIRDDPIGGDTLNFALPAYPVSNSKAVSNYYYNTYGDSWEDNSEVNEIVYNNNTTTIYPVTYDNNIPLWLIQSNSTIETFDYSLELPSAPLETLPADFEGGGSFFQNSFVVLGGFGAFVLVGLSFSLVGLFFKE